jgi:uncharacterized membrane protein required for colicin V production
MSSSDLILLGIIGLGGISGLFGVVRVAGPDAALFAAVSAVYAYPDLSGYFGQSTLVPFFLGLILCFVFLVVYALLARVFHPVVHAAGFGRLNRLVGVVLGLVMGTILAGAFVWGIEHYGRAQDTALFDRSLLAPTVKDFSEVFMGFIRRSLPPPRKQWWQFW